VELQDVLVFEVEGQRFGVFASAVEEVARAVAVAPLPRAPAVVDGIINVRGRLAPVLDLRRRFRLRDKPVDPTEHFVLARCDGRLVTLRADRVLGLQRVRAADLEQPRTATTRADHVAGVAKLPEGLVMVYDLESFLTEAESKELGWAVTTAQGVD
jgi:purine-binding chemotaxis protein CheW